MSLVLKGVSKNFAWIKTTNNEMNFLAGPDEGFHLKHCFSFWGEKNENKDVWSEEKFLFHFFPNDWKDKISWESGKWWQNRFFVQTIFGHQSLISVMLPLEVFCWMIIYCKMILLVVCQRWTVKNQCMAGSGCCAVRSDPRDPRFKSDIFKLIFQRRLELRKRGWALPAFLRSHSE